MAIRAEAAKRLAKVLIDPLERGTTELELELAASLIQICVLNDETAKLLEEQQKPYLEVVK